MAATNRFTAASAALSVALILTGAPACDAAASHPHRLPKDFKWGRCLLVVDGKTRISGRCAYSISAGGDFIINGPRQVYSGIDYPVAHIYAEEMSRDYWARVFKEQDGTWTGYGNDDIRATHGARPYETLRRQGACYVNEAVRVCLWRK
jgi:hypothetical protein